MEEARNNPLSPVDLEPDPQAHPPSRRFNPGRIPHLINSLHRTGLGFRKDLRMGSCWINQRQMTSTSDRWAVRV